MSISQTEWTGNRLESCGSLRLSEGDTIKFLELYRDEMILYDSSVAEYRNRHLRKEASKRIADAMDIPGFGARQVTKKFKNLRNAYAQEIRKIEDRKSYIIPSNVDSVYVPKVHWFSTMNSFLRPFIYRRFTVTGAQLKKRKKVTARQCTGGSQLLDEENYNDEVMNYGANEGDVIVMDKSSDSYDANFDDDDEGTSDKGSSTTGSHSAASKRRPQRAHRTSTVTVPKVDDFDIFGKIVASHLRQLPLQTVLEAQRFIIDYLIKTRLEHVSGAPATPEEVVEPPPSDAITAIRSLRPESPPQTLELSCDSSDSEPDL